MSDDPVERARGRWREILTAAGINPSFLVNKHGGCPVCGGKDRFRFDDKHGEGTAICTQCGASNGILLLRRFKRCDHRTALDFVREIIGKGGDRPAYVPKPDAPRDSSSAAKLLAESTSPEVLLDYLRRRGLSPYTAALQGHPRCPYFVEKEDKKGNRKWRVLGHYPAAIAPIVAADGTLIGVQRVYDAAVPERKKVLGDMKGGVVRLGEPDDELAVCEGWETGLAVRELFGFPVWAALSANNLAIFEPPPTVTRLHVFGDNDESCEGQAAAYNLAVRLNRKARQQKTALEPVKVYLPANVGTDWLDVLKQGGLQ
jgi:putative DNA primase/helicase